MSAKQVRTCTIYIAICGMLLGMAYLRNRNNIPGIIVSDTEGYYMYLPAAFIMHDIHHVPERTMNARKNDKGEVVIKYTYGTSLFYLPFFIGAHIYAHAFHYDTSGFSTPYYYGIMLCGVFWATVACYLLMRLLRRHFSFTVSLITTLCITCGTNFFFYSSKWMGMSHIYSFVLVAAIVILAEEWYKQAMFKNTAVMALLLGWLVLIRPTNIFFLLFLFLYQVTTLADLRERMRYIWTRRSFLLAGALLFLLPFVPQMLYWKIMTGHWVHYSYEGEGFIYYLQPKIAAVLFDTQNGLFVYAPILLLLFAGFIIAPRDRRTNTIAIIPLFIMLTYAFASWWAWWFGAAYGHRCYIEYLPVFALPIAVLIERISSARTATKTMAMAFIAACIIYNIGMTHVSDKTGNIWDGPQWRWNWALWTDMVKQIV